MAEVELETGSVPNKRGQFLALLIMFVVSLPLTAAANRLGGALFAQYDPSLGVLLYTAIPSFLVIMLLFAGFGSLDMLKLARPWNRGHGAMRLSLAWIAAWLAGSLLLAVAQGHWPTYVHDWPSRTGFLLFGPIGEELLFRGIVFERARRVWPGSSTPAILVSTVAFSLHHLFLNTAPEGLLIPQLLFTLPMGMVFAALRARTGSLWPGIALHMLTNLPFAF